jgi:hypothetical protein
MIFALFQALGGARMAPDQPEEPVDENEGEGNKSADRTYRKGIEDFLKSSDVERLAEEARQDVERNPEAFEEARRTSLEHIAEEDPEVSQPLEHAAAPAESDEADLEPASDWEAEDFRDVRAGTTPPQVRRVEDAEHEKQKKRKAA